MYQLPLNSSGLPANSTWTTYGTNLPNVLVDSLEYNQQTDTLVAGTLGRGVWEVTNASQTIGQPQTLQITGSVASSPITVEADPNNPLNVLVTQGAGNNQSIPLGSFQAIDITTNGADVIIGSQGTTIAGTTSFLNVPLTITGSSGGQLTIEDAASTTATVITMTNTQIGSATGNTLFGAGGSLTYSGMSAVSLDLGLGNDAVSVQSTAAESPRHRQPGNRH